MEAMPPTESLWRSLRLKMRCWARKSSEWQTAAEKALAAPVGMAEELPSDPFARLERCKRVALNCVRSGVLGETGGEPGEVRRLIPHQSEAARREIHT